MPDFLLYTIVTQWDEPPRARHQIANELKKLGAVYFVEKNKKGSARIEINKVEENVVVITPFFPIDYRIRYRTPIINEIYHQWLLRQIKRLDISFDVVITVDYTAPAIHQYFDRVIFYCADDNVGFGNFNPWLINYYHTRTEKKVAAGATICVVTSDYMQSKISKYNNRCYNIPLGAPEVTINEVRMNDKKETLPTLGLVGYLDSNLDESLLYSLLAQFKIVFIGPASDETKAKMAKFTNATMLGPQTGNQLIESLQNVDVCIAPYDLKKINKGATPNKLWLYLSVGRPSVITKIPNIQSWKFENDMVYICNNDEFAGYCKIAYDRDNIMLANERIRTAKESSWHNRVNQILKLFYNS